MVYSDVLLDSQFQNAFSDSYTKVSRNRGCFRRWHIERLLPWLLLHIQSRLIYTDSFILIAVVGTVIDGRRFRCSYLTPGSVLTVSKDLITAWMEQQLSRTRTLSRQKDVLPQHASSADLPLAVYLCPSSLSVLHANQFVLYFEHFSVYLTWITLK